MGLVASFFRADFEEDAKQDSAIALMKDPMKERSSLELSKIASISEDRKSAIWWENARHTSFR